MAKRSRRKLDVDPPPPGPGFLEVVGCLALVVVAGYLLYAAAGWVALRLAFYGRVF
jgi:hypothetical protein